jgi:hypothetical protein
VVGDFAQESYPERDKAYCANRLALLRARDGYGRLVTTHDGWALHFDQRYGGLLDSVTDQKHDHLAERAGRRRRRLRPMPVLNEEFAYECGPGGVEDLSYHPRVRHTAEEHALRSWEVVFGGADPGDYYLYPAWDVVRPDALPPGYALPQRLVDFMRETEWWLLEPHPEVVERSVARCLARPGQEYLIFNRAGFGPRRHFDEATRATLTLPGLSGPSGPSGSYAGGGPAPVLQADWLQPWSGERTQTEIQVQSRFPLQAPFDGPYVVRLRPA